ncbi:MAG: DNA translocase FtsK, partial [Gemmatimonadota bacterium]|nr:DNA translocase FtsK [Gemmatimonadota bacterium]
GPLSAAFGWAGAALLLGFLFAALCVATVGWNPLRSVVGGGRFAWLRTRRLAGGLSGMLPAVQGAAPPAPTSLPAEDAPPEEETQLSAPEPESPEPQPAKSFFSGLTSRRAAKPAPEPALPLPIDPGDPDSPDLPPAALLALPPPRNEARSRQELDELGRVLIHKLDTFKISGEVVGMTAGPVVTQFEVAPAPGIKVSRIASLEADLALAMRAPSIRILAPIPGKGAVGVEVPNPAPEIVVFREVIEDASFKSSKAQLPLALGKDISGRPFVADLAKMPHLLIAGATGSGKSVCINTIITSLIYRHTPRTLRLLMVDPKMVELVMYNDLPHLRHEVVTDNSDAGEVLKFAMLLMERRYKLLSLNGARNLEQMNQRLAAGHELQLPEGEEEDPRSQVEMYDGSPLPYYVLIIDELADLMMTVQGEVEKPLAMLAQKARAIGLHLILATQRPSVNEITGLIKANFPSRIAFRVVSKVDSRTILDQNGADALLGNGDMLFLPPGQGDPTRIQGAYISTEETEALMTWYREQAERRREERAWVEPDILEVVRANQPSDANQEGFEAASHDRDPLFREAAELCIQFQGGSTSLLQRRLGIGYGRAARIIDQLHYAGVLGPPNSSKPREVLVDMLQLEAI